MDHCDYNTLECRLKAAKKRISELESGEKYRELQALRQKDAAYYNRAIKDEKRKAEAAHAETKRVREIWSGIVDDLDAEYQEKLADAARALEKMEERALRAERQRDEALEKLMEAHRKYYETASELEEEKGKNQKLQAQLNRDFENSSIPSSKSRKPKKITNSREKTGRKPGAQPGHEGHHRKRQEPTSSHKLPPPQEVLDDPDFRPASKIKSKQMVSIELRLVVNELTADTYYNPKTNEYLWAKFPEGYVNEVNYDASIRAFLYLLNNDCNVSIDKSRKFLSDLTGGKLNISKGMVNSLLKEFADSMDNEPELTWSREMHSLIQEMIHYRNSLPDDEEPDSDKVADFEKRYDEAVAKACEEYSDSPPSDYYKEGYNL